MRDVEIRKILLAVDVPGYWTSARDKRKTAAITSGTTSIRVSKKTLSALRQLGRLVAEADPGGRSSAGWRGWYVSPPLGELLEWIANAAVIRPNRELVNACNLAIAGKHAKPDVGKSMQSAGRLHAGRGSR